MKERLESPAVTKVREATKHSVYENNLWLVGGYVRDKVLHYPGEQQDVDIVLEDNALGLARFLRESGVADIEPVVYPRFGTAMVIVLGQNVELVTARCESYAEGSRKPSKVQPASLADDARRRDFTINTLIENLHTGEIRDPLGKAISDIDAKIIRTPRDPFQTFADDPLRMLRAIRFAVRLNFTIDPETWNAIEQEAVRLAPPTVSLERVRDEFLKILMTARPSAGLELLRRSGLLAQFAPELAGMVGVMQNEFHAYAVWDHTLLAVDDLVRNNPNASITLRLGMLLHDVGKPRTKSTGEDGRIHFYNHQEVGADIAYSFLSRLKLPNQEIHAVRQLVAQHMRIGEYQPALWTDAAVRRFVRAAGPKLEELFAIFYSDVSALAPQHRDVTHAEQLHERIEKLQAHHDSNAIVSPLTGEEIMQILGIAQGEAVGLIKEWLANEVIEDRLAPGDKEAAKQLVLSRASGDMLQ